MRGLAPLLVAVASLVVLPHTPSPGLWLGIAAISAGVIWIGGVRVRSLRSHAQAAGFALGNAFIIAAYTLVDGLGVRAAGDPMSYGLWLFLRLSSCVRGSDTACRYGGDEFVVLLPDIDRREQAVAVCEKIENQFALAYFIDGTPIRATISLGMATFPADGKDCFELIRVADRAMYRSKARTQKEPAGRWHGGF
jgi:predicted signal transduction protein with EAL and GGDEF domain